MSVVLFIVKDYLVTHMKQQDSEILLNMTGKAFLPINIYHLKGADEANKKLLEMLALSYINGNIRE